MTESRLTFFRAQDGSPRASAAGEAERVLARFLESDLQDDPATTSELLDRLNKPVADDDETDAFVGNAFAMTRDGDTLTLAGNVDGNDQSAMLDRETTVRTVQDWLSFISK